MEVFDKRDKSYDTNISIRQSDGFQCHPETIEQAMALLAIPPENDPIQDSPISPSPNDMYGHPKSPRLGGWNSELQNKSKTIEPSSAPDMEPTQEIDDQRSTNYEVSKSNFPHQDFGKTYLRTQWV